jgi:hypothetical protein
MRFVAIGVIVRADAAGSREPMPHRIVAGAITALSWVTAVRRGVEDFLSHGGQQLELTVHKYIHGYLSAKLRKAAKSQRRRR